MSELGGLLGYSIYDDNQGNMCTSSRLSSQSVERVPVYPSFTVSTLNLGPSVRGLGHENLCHDTL